MWARERDFNRLRVSKRRGAGGFDNPRLRPLTFLRGARVSTYVAVPSAGASGSQTIPMRSGHRGTAQTIQAMRALIDAGIKNQGINRLAVQIVRNTPEFSEAPKVQAIYEWMRAHIRFVADAVGKEVLRTPEETIQVGAGDCDCMTVLIATLAGTAGMTSRAVTVSTDPSEPNTYSHVYPEVFADGQWIPVDCARPNSALGLSPNRYFLKKEWDLFGQGSRQISGLSGLGKSMGCPGVKGMGRGDLGAYLGASRGAHRRGMGDFDLSDISSILTPQLVQATTTGTAQIINAENGMPTNLYSTASVGIPGVPAGYAYNNAGQLVPAANVSTPIGYAYNASGQLVQTSALATTSGISGSTLLLLLVLGAAALVLA